MPYDGPESSTPPAGQQPRDPSPRPSPIREALHWRFSDPEDAAAVHRLRDLLYELVNESGQFGPEHGKSRVRPAPLAVARDLLLEASNLTEIAEVCHWSLN